jgi:hypothetical protein
VPTTSTPGKLKMKKNLRKAVEDEIVYGRHHEVIGDFSQSERQLYESQDFEFTNTGFLMKKKDPCDPDYSWDVLAFIKSNQDLAEIVQSMLDSGERLLRQIYTDRETFLMWLDFFDQLNEEGFCHDGFEHYKADHVEINEKITTGYVDAMDYIETGIAIETVGQRGIYCVEQEEEEEDDYLGNLIDPYQSTHNLPRDKYRTIRFVGFNEPEPEGKLHAERREETLRKIQKALQGTRHRTFVAKMRHRMSAMWEEDKKVYAALKERSMTLDDASEVMHLTADQWKQAFELADQAWERACQFDEWYFSPEQKTKRRIRSNSLRDKYKVQVINAKTTDRVEDIMRHVNGNRKLGFLWKNDYKDVRDLATMQWKLLKSQESNEE